MRRWLVAVALLSAFVVPVRGDPPAGTVPLSGTATVAFSPNGQAQAVIVAAIGTARHSIRVQAYSFTNRAIIAALVDAKRRGVDVRAIVDKTDTRGRAVSDLLAAGIPVWVDYRPSIAHNKVMILDGDSVITGSFNFTAAAQERNAENVILLQHSPAVAKLYADDWTWRQGQSRQIVSP